MRVLAIFLIALGLAGPAAGKSLQVFKSGGWTGMASYNSRGRFTACTIVARYTSGTLVAMSVTPRNKWIIAVKRRGGYPRNKTFFTTLSVDGQQLFSGRARSLNSGIVRLNIPGKIRLINALRRGRVLRLATRGGSSSYKLSGTRQAIARMIKCAIKRNGTVRGGRLSRTRPGGAFSAPSSNSRSSAFTSPKGRRASTTKTPPSRKIARDKLIVFASNFLARAGFTGFQIMPYQKFKKVADVVWRLSDGSLGTLSAYPHSPRISLDGVSGSVIGSATRACKGDFASGKRKSDIQSGMEIRRLFASCNEAKSPFEAQYSLIRMLNGDIIKISHIRLGKSANAMDPGHMQRTEKAVLRAAKLNPNALR